jgi:hypothetical protein
MKTESNRKNSLKSTGPRTPRGKSHSRCNSGKHQLYSRELFVSEGDKPAFQEMRAGLEAELHPGGILRWLAFDYVVACLWRIVLALRLEHRQFSRLLQDEDVGHEREAPPDVVPVIRRWYGASRMDTRAAIKGVDWARREFDCCGYFKDETKAFLTFAFGADFVPRLEKWITTSKDTILMMEHLVAHEKDFGTPKGMEPAIPTTESTKVVIDPKQGRQMVDKLLEERRNFLAEYLAMTGEAAFAEKSDDLVNAGFNARFLADAHRELQRALKDYWALEERGK